MKLIKKSIFAVLIIAAMGIFVTKTLSNTTVNELLDQNIEALALEDPEHPSNPGMGYGGGYDIYEFDTWVQSYWVNCWSSDGQYLLHTTTCQYKFGHGNPTGQCKVHVIIIVG
jgi:hypothetical protein